MISNLLSKKDVKRIQHDTIDPSEGHDVMTMWVLSLLLLLMLPPIQGNTKIAARKARELCSYAANSGTHDLCIINNRKWFA